MTQTTEKFCEAFLLFMGGAALTTLGVLPFVVAAVAPYTAVIALLLLIVVLLFIATAGSGGSHSGNTYIYYNSGCNGTSTTTSTTSASAGWILAGNIIFAIFCFSGAIFMFSLALEALQEARNQNGNWFELTKTAPRSANFAGSSTLVHDKVEAGQRTFFDQAPSAPTGEKYKTTDEYVGQPGLEQPGLEQPGLEQPGLRQPDLN